MMYDEVNDQLPLSELIEVAERQIDKTKHELAYWREIRRKLCAKRRRQQVKAGIA